MNSARKSGLTSEADQPPYGAPRYVEVLPSQLPPALANPKDGESGKDPDRRGVTARVTPVPDGNLRRRAHRAGCDPRIEQGSERCLRAGRGRASRARCPRPVLAQFFGPDAINDRLILVETISFTTTPDDMMESLTRIVAARPMLVAVPARRRGARPRRGASPAGGCARQPPHVDRMGESAQRGAR